MRCPGRVRRPRREGDAVSDAIKIAVLAATVLLVALGVLARSCDSFTNCAEACGAAGVDAVTTVPQYNRDNVTCHCRKVTP